MGTSVPTFLQALSLTGGLLLAAACSGPPEVCESCSTQENEFVHGVADALGDDIQKYDEETVNRFLGGGHQVCDDLASGLTPVATERLGGSGPEDLQYFFNSAVTASAMTYLCP